MDFIDRGEISGVRLTKAGYLVADVRAARTGIQIYTGAEVGRPDLERVRVYRSPEEVFAADAMRSYAHLPVTLGHPRDMVDAETWKNVSVGQTDGDVVRDGEFVRVPMMVMDAAAIARIEAGDREISMGYQAQIEFGDGVTPDGQPYDAMQKSLRMNHLAIVDRARGGSDLKIGDDHNGGADMADPKTRTILVDGLSVETTDAGAQAIEKLQKQLADAAAAAASSAQAHETVLAQKDAEIDDLKGKVLTDAQRDALVQGRADLIATAKRLVPTIATDGKSDADIRREVVVAKLGDAAIAGKTEPYIDARFDILAETKAADPFQAARGGSPAAPVGPPSFAQMDDAGKAYAEMMDRQANAWRGQGWAGTQKEAN